MIDLFQRGASRNGKADVLDTRHEGNVRANAGLVVIESWPLSGASYEKMQIILKTARREADESTDGC